ncbi:hypothetical protein SeMB42_g02973 [Synchytrium endobioticum]|uniref:protein-histidine N-methyltransferase n=1 Tax=Synchytrium endobioticum TaxID=286115 RepID=A0A507DAS7_9FUNG|nr:hypothetical protein SeMB42_g02973 [Synchytrium endobioticum]TPX49037.1 hypothetical protein SeLEV6574_g01715 [Synchytrium endobioticum]
MFRFNFQVDDDEDGDINMAHSTEPTPSDTTIQPPPRHRVRAKHISPPSDPITVHGTLLELTPNTSFFQRDHPDLRSTMKELSRSSSWIQRSLDGADLISGLYEGGFKTWEGTSDLIKLFETEIEDSWWYHKSVLELGCGQGLPGIYCLQRGSDVTFQDYNEEVIYHLTMPNILLNQQFYVTPPKRLILCASPSSMQNASFVSGDWSRVKRLFDEGGKKYDVILTAETVYNDESHVPLFEILKSALKADGTIFLAAKSNYFGCSGDLASFLQLVDEDGSMKWETVHVVTKTVRREVIRLTFVNQHISS